VATQNNHPALDKLRKANATKVKVAVSDIDGVLRGKYLHIDKFEGAADGGFGFCDVVFGWDMRDVTYDNTRSPAGSTAFPDALARLDLDTRATCPGTERALLPGRVRQRRRLAASAVPAPDAQAVLARAEKLGFQVMTGMEFEWFNFRETPHTWAAKKGVPPEPITPGMFGYSLLRMADNPASSTR
jgi:glutamine synthetase